MTESISSVYSPSARLYMGLFRSPDKSTVHGMSGSSERKLTGTVKLVVKEASSLFRTTVSPAAREPEEARSFRVV